MRRRALFSIVILASACAQPVLAQYSGQYTPPPATQGYRDGYRPLTSRPAAPPPVYYPGPDRGGRIGITFDNTTTYQKDGRTMIKVLSVPDYFGGLAPGDFIYAVNGIQFTDLAGFIQLAAEKPPLAWVTLSYLDSDRGYALADQTAILYDARALPPAAPPPPAAPAPYRRSPTPQQQPSYAAQQSELNRVLDRVVQKDSAGWWVNVYQPGSMRDARIVSQSNDGKTFVVRGDFRYEGGSSGWVETKISGDKLVCLQYQDSWGGCRSIYNPDQTSGIGAAVVAGLVVAVVALAVAGGSGGSAGSNGSDSPGTSGGDRGPDSSSPSTPSWADRPRKPTPPIGDLYGCASPPCWSTGGPPPE